MNYGWLGSIETFLQVPLADWLTKLSEHYKTVIRVSQVSKSQIDAWVDAFEVLRRELTRLVQLKPTAVAWSLIFEYELPREGGRRPDVVILAGDVVIVVECKEKSLPSQADVDQTSAYARDLRHYHQQTHGRTVHALLLPTNAVGLTQQIDDVLVTPPTSLAQEIARLAPVGAVHQIDGKAWAASDYAPLPTLIDAAKRIFDKEPLPYIRRAYAEAGIPSVLEYLRKVVRQAQAMRERHLVLITGVPGAGKTLVGLQFVHDHWVNETGRDGRNAVFLSGNDPLVEVLQYQLKSRIFVQSVRSFTGAYGAYKVPGEHVLVFDEAQRAWSRDQMLAKNKGAMSEPETLVRIAERLPDWAVIVGLVGEGQEIHVGEEAGVAQWAEAMAAGNQEWCVHLPPALQQQFTDSAEIEAQPILNLTTSMRTHVAQKVQAWIAHLLAGEVSQAAALAPEIRQEGFHLYVTRSLDEAKRYARDRYAGEPHKRYGLVASSKPSNSIVDQAVPRDFTAMKVLKKGPWYSDEPTSPRSCCQLSSAVTEFECQGLELDLPILCWGDDLWWGTGGWESKLLPQKAQNPRQLRINAYRVLLSRGRDGVVIWVPEGTKLDRTYALLRRVGVSELQAVRPEA